MVKPDCGRLDNKSKASDWEKNALSSVAPLQRGFDLPTSQLQDGEFPVVYSNGVLNFHRYAMVEGPGVVTGRSGTIGNVHYLENDFWPHNTTLWVTDFRGNYPKFVFYLYQFIDLSKFSTGSGVPTLNRNDVHAHTVRIPPLTEQKAIASALSDVDALIESLDRLIAKKRDIKQAAMQELLTGKKRLPGFEGEWDNYELRTLVKEFIVPMRDKPKQFGGNIPWCRIEDFDGVYLAESKTNRYVDSQTISEMNLKVCPIGTLLVSCSADLGRCAIVKRPLVTNQTFIGLVINETKASNLFFYYLMTSKAVELNNLSSGTTISYLSREQFEEYEVHAPREKKEQTAIATALMDIDEELDALCEQLTKVQQVKQGMMQELLTGRIRLV